MFSLDPGTGAETVLYSFCSKKICADGANPSASLINVNGILYGTTAYGGMYGCGTVFSIDPTTGVMTVLYTFRDGADGANPSASLIDVNGVLYGTTLAGGGDSADCDIGANVGCGTVFVLDLINGAETVLHAFHCSDGKYPYASLIDVNGTLYGTTANRYYYGRGTVFSVDTASGAFKVVHSFSAGTDGANPHAGLIDVHGTLYGTTVFGGSSGAAASFTGSAKGVADCCAGYGTVFALKKY